MSVFPAADSRIDDRLLFLNEPQQHALFDLEAAKCVARVCGDLVTWKVNGRSVHRQVALFPSAQDDLIGRDMGKQRQEAVGHLLLIEEVRPVHNHRTNEPVVGHEDPDHPIAELPLLFVGRRDIGRPERLTAAITGPKRLPSDLSGVGQRKKRSVEAAQLLVYSSQPSLLLFDPELLR